MTKTSEPGGSSKRVNYGIGGHIKLAFVRKILDLDFKNSYHLNIFFLWDILQSVRLEIWKNHYGSRLSLWFEILAQVDELCSFAGFAFQHPEAVFSKVVTDGFRVKGKNLKHPFIDPADIAGWSQHDRESTYLRTAGINYVFAMTGAPVLADCFIFSPVQLFTRFKIPLNLIQVIPIQQIPGNSSGKINYAGFGF